MKTKYSHITSRPGNCKRKLRIKMIRYLLKSLEHRSFWEGMGILLFLLAAWFCIWKTTMSSLIIARNLAYGHSVIKFIWKKTSTIPFIAYRISRWNLDMSLTWGTGIGLTKNDFIRKGTKIRLVSTMCWKEKKSCFLFSKPTIMRSIIKDWARTKRIGAFMIRGMDASRLWRKER